MRKLLVGLLAVLATACGDAQGVKPLHAIDITWQHPSPEFRLSGPDGKVHSLSEFRGKVVIVFFGYTHCPEVCPTTLADLAQVMRQMGEQARDVQVLFVTLDPERDKPEVLGRFVPFFDERFLGLSGDAAATDRAARSFGVNYQKVPGKDGSYTMDHSDGTYLIGRDGRTLWMSRYGQRTDYLLEDVRLLLTTGAGG